MPEFPDTTSGVVEADGYPGPTTLLPTVPFDKAHPRDDSFGYYKFEDMQGARIGTGLRFWAGYPDRNNAVQIANHSIYDFFSNSVWPQSFRSVPEDSVDANETGDRVPAPQTRVRHLYDDPVSAHPNVPVPQTIHWAYRISHPGQPGGPRVNVGWLFIKDQAASEITIAVDYGLIDHGRPFHMGVAECHFVHQAPPPAYDLSGLWGLTLKRP